MDYLSQVLLSPVLLSCSVNERFDALVEREAALKLGRGLTLAPLGVERCVRVYL